MTFRAATATTHLGRYHVVKRLAQGGMADVLLARTDGIAGFERHVVIKRIHAELLEEQRYVKMFLDEARLAASLHHHNIVQVNDIGEENGEYFFAMEYVHGEDARTLLVQASQRGEDIPLEHVITIITAAAAGLHHAHEQRNLDGTPLHIVHRDVSPANILVGFDGAVKVADFGIASAAQRAERTQSGVLKGKAAYMSPEQCNCDLVDRRSDLFSLGIVLYELVTVRPCFAADNDFLTMAAIVAGQLERPGAFRKDLPPDLEAIVMKALAPRANDRFQTADEMRGALEQFAADAKLRTSATALAEYMKKQFGAKPLPWQDGDVEYEEAGNQPRQHLAVSDRDDDLAVPVEGALGRVPTLLRPALDTRPPAEIIVGGSDARPSAEIIVVEPPETEAEPRPEGKPESFAGDARQSGSAVKRLRFARIRKRWLAGSVVAFVVAAASLITVSTGGDHAIRAGLAPATRATAPVPLARPTVAPENDPVQRQSSPPAKKSVKRSGKKPAKKWDPNQLFPD